MQDHQGRQQLQTLRLRVRGVVQGVGFRPFIFRLAEQWGLSGWVRNDQGGVLLEVSGRPEVLEQFLEAIPHQAPPAARVEQVEVLSQGPGSLPSGFAIVPSDTSGPVATQVSPDLSTCPDCLSEMFDPTNRRYRYPLINCTNCGPRYSIILQLPYDRPFTTMRAFAICPDCAAEYHHPRNRRFHAQPTACPVCGPQVYLWDARLQLLASQHQALVRGLTCLARGISWLSRGWGAITWPAMPKTPLR